MWLEWSNGKILASFLSGWSSNPRRVILFPVLGWGEVQRNCNGRRGARSALFWVLLSIKKTCVRSSRECSVANTSQLLYNWSHRKTWSAIPCTPNPAHSSSLSLLFHFGTIHPSTLLGFFPFSERRSSGKVLLSFALSQIVFLDSQYFPYFCFNSLLPEVQYLNILFKINLLGSLKSWVSNCIVRKLWEAKCAQNDTKRENTFFC